jgi:hypothetical protein
MKRVRFKQAHDEKSGQSVVAYRAGAEYNVADDVAERVITAGKAELVDEAPTGASSLAASRRKVQKSGGPG